MPSVGIVSASHDGSIRLWALSGELLLEMVGHTSIVYSVDGHESGLLVSGSEDCSDKIWKDGTCVQSIDHPGCVWDAKFLGNGDIVTACSDGIVRIWTIDHDRVADATQLDSFTAQLSQYKISRKIVGGMKLEDLPGLDALKTPGTRDGQTKVVREGDNGVAYAWNMKEYQWDKIGEVVDGPDDNTKRPVLDGVQYDYVFDVDIEDGEPVRKLHYNRSDNPYDVAAQGKFTCSLSATNCGIYSSKYRTERFNSRSVVSGPVHWLAYVPGASSRVADVSMPSYKHIPKKGMLAFDVAQFDGILKKITEFNNTLLSDMDKQHLSLNEGDMSRLNAIVKVLKDTSHYHSSSISDIDVALILKLLNTWPVAMLFPVADVMRMIVLHPDGASKLHNYVKDKNDIVIELIRKVTTSPPLPANLLTSIRAVTNLFKNSCFNEWLQIHRAEIIDAFSSSCSSSNKNVQISYATLLLNYAVLLIEKKDEEGQSQVLSAALEMAEGEAVDTDSKFRALVTIGSLMVEGLVKRVAIDFDVVNIAKAAKASKDSKIAEVGADIELVAKQS